MENSYQDRVTEVVSFVESRSQHLDNVEHFLQRIKSINSNSIPANDRSTLKELGSFVIKIGPVQNFITYFSNII